ncbi:MAG: efflux RND transporter periplasmic adaptor subunit [Planctomycetales bacterium]|nr:efflux RND transporter periplasmic adaptor subunit [Planctomycetales bacterium]
MSDKPMPPAKKKFALVPLIALVVRWVLILGGTAAVVLLLMLLAGVFDNKVHEEAHASHERSLSSDAQVATVKIVEQPRFESAVGAIEPMREAALAAKILAKVVEVNVKAGQMVTEGDVLVRLNDDDLQSRLKQAEAHFQSAQAQAQQAQIDLDRAQQLVGRNAISRAEFDSASTAVRVSEAQLEAASRSVEEARVFLDYATIRAPMSGIVVDKQVEAGDTVLPGQTLLSLYDPDQMQLVANVRESLALKLQVGQQVPAKLESLDHECLATIREIVPQADAASRTFQVKVSGPCPPGIYSGMFGRLRLPLETERLIVIPTQAVRRVGQLTLVEVVEAGLVSRRSIQLGRELGNQVEVLAGLSPGEQVVLTAASAEGAGR